MVSKEQICREIKKRNLDHLIKFDELLKFHSSWKVGGPADFFCIPPNNISTLKKLVTFAFQHDIPVYIIGNGSNILVPDEGIRGLVIKISNTLDKIDYSGKMIKVGAGILLSHLVTLTTNKGLSGLEFAAHIPGTLGGAIVNNAGFENFCIGKIVKKVFFLDRSGIIREWKSPDLKFYYRGSCFSQHFNIVLEADLNLNQRDKSEILSKIKQFYYKRKNTQPITELTAGCIFKNPSDYTAGYLIEHLGIKGLSIGDAQVSRKHANFIINKGNASATDILKLIEEIEKRVEYQYGIKLEREIEVLNQHN
jgi:UDP-N-acetylmuramate dehydrogenase